VISFFGKPGKRKTAKTFGKSSFYLPLAPSLLRRGNVRGWLSNDVLGGI
jgi:hypothetical protein